MPYDDVPEGYVPSLEIHKRLLDHALIMRTMSPEMVALYLDKYLPDIEGYDRVWTIRHYAGTRRRQHIKAQKQDSVFAAAVFMAGVSLGDLAMLFGIRKQTAAQKVHKHTTPQERETMRDAPPMVDLEALELAKRIFDDAVLQGYDYVGLTPLEIGRALLKAAHALVTDDRGTTDMPDRPRRYANMNISQPEPTSDPEPSDPPASGLSEPVTPAPANVLRPEEQDFLNNL